MRPTLQPDDVLLVRILDGAPVTAVEAPSPGRLVLVRWPDLPIAVKRLLQREHDGRWWVERDSPVAGTDSFSHGAVPSDGLVGVVLARCWPRPSRLRRSAARP